MPSEMPPSEMEGMLERKQELQGGGKKATIRSWKNYYTVLCGQLLCFFKDRHGKILITENFPFAEDTLINSPVRSVMKEGILMLAVVETVGIPLPLKPFEIYRAIENYTYS